MEVKSVCKKDFSFENAKIHYVGTLSLTVMKKFLLQNLKNSKRFEREIQSLKDALHLCILTAIITAA